MLEFLLTNYICLCIAAPEFVNSVKENNKKLASAFLEKAKEICASHGVRHQISFLSLTNIRSLCSNNFLIFALISVAMAIIAAHGTTQSKMDISIQCQRLKREVNL